MDFSAICLEIATKLHNAKIEKGHIPKDLYQATATQLMDAVFTGTGKKSFQYGDRNNLLLAHLQNNIYSFSAAKSLTEMKLFNELLIDKDGNPKSKAQFRNDVAATGAVFNKNYLATEQANALACADAAVTWNQYNDDDWLQISTVGDDRVRPEHARLDKFTAKKSDPVWLRLWFPFDWGCRCVVIPGSEKNQTKDFKTSQMLTDAKIPEQFQRNTGIDKVVFDEEGHPYYKNSFNEQKELRADVNYGMHSVSKIYADNIFPAAEKLESKGDANSWWADTAGSLKGHFDVADHSGISVRFDNVFRVHVMEDNKDRRFKIITNLEDIVTDPDEVWSIKENGKLINTYIKYYEDFPYTVQTEDCRAFTMYAYEHKAKLNEQSIKMDRRGILLFRKN